MNRSQRQRPLLLNFASGSLFVSDLCARCPLSRDGEHVDRGHLAYVWDIQPITDRKDRQGIPDDGCVSSHVVP